MPLATNCAGSTGLIYIEFRFLQQGSHQPLNDHAYVILRPVYENIFRISVMVPSQSMAREFGPIQL